jgi:hypothetical protein
MIGRGGYGPGRAEGIGEEGTARVGSGYWEVTLRSGNLTLPIKLI